jgi:tRNA-splicing ligase RtcB
MFTGTDLINAGIAPGKWFVQALAAANAVLAAGGSPATAIEAAHDCVPKRLPLREAGAAPLHVNLIAESAEEQENLKACIASMTELMRTPVARAGALMPDACPAGPAGTIPVGGIVASEAIHPGMHSADICCSMALSIFPGVAPKALLDAVNAVTHFGPGARPAEMRVPLPDEVGRAFAANAMLKHMVTLAEGNFATQGDGNHFAYVGTMKSTGETALVTHHGSRGPGAALYKAGMQAAERQRQVVSPETLPQNAWIRADTKEGDAYWSALQAVRLWTRANHFAIHDLAAERLAAKVSDRFWNEHNFIFRRSDGLFYHGKGATPAFDGWADDATDLTIIPLNMAEPILITRGRNAANGLGFSPHGAGRNYSRTKHKRLQAGRAVNEILAEETAGLDVRFYMGITDVSELPSAYKNAASVRAQIARFALAEIVDEVLPYGCIMAGDWEQNAPWRRAKARSSGDVQ